MQATANAKYIRGSPQKARLVIDQIRGKDCGEALDILRFSHKRAAKQIEKALRSAIANAENREENVDVDKLYVRHAIVNEGPRSKRIRPAPMGRAFRYQRRTSHIQIQVEERE